MKHLKPYRVLNESESRTLIPFLLGLTVYSSSQSLSYFFCGAFYTFQEFIMEVGDQYDINKQDLYGIQDIGDFMEAIEQNQGRGGVTWNFWCHDLELVEQKEKFRSFDMTNPYRACANLNMFFKNAESIMDRNYIDYSRKGGENLEYLVRSVENDNLSLNVYSEALQDKIIGKLNWDQKKVDAIKKIGEIGYQF